MLLKIGRAANVQRRMNQWQMQCGYDVEVLRYYPYTGDSSGSSIMTPHSKRVERLVHVELSGDYGLRRGHVALVDGIIGSGSRLAPQGTT